MKHELTRYNNRKLYSKSASQYVTLGDVVLMVKAGEQVRVVQYEGGEDITTRVLRRAFAKVNDEISVEYLHDLIKTEAN